MHASIICAFTIGFPLTIYVLKTGVLQLNRDTAFGVVLASVLLRPSPALRWCLALACTLMATFPRFAKALHVTIENREQPILSSTEATP